MSRQREQRLQAIYDAFDARNYKGAIKLSNTALQKYPDKPVFKALKAVALERTGKRDEALQLVDDLLALAPPDDHVLNMLLLVLKPAKRTDSLQKAYETACNKDPSNIDLLQGLFGCHVRSANYQGQQQVAMKLNKLHPNDMYQWWIVTSLALQAHAEAARTAITANTAAETDRSDGASSDAVQATPVAPSGLGADKLLQLAEAMATRLLNKHTGCCPPSWEAVMLYLGLLQAQGKHDEALAALRGPLAKAFSLSAERREAEAALLSAKGDLMAAAGLYEQALLEQPDDWALLLLYLDCLLPGTACTSPAISSTSVAQMLTGVEASTSASFLMGSLRALMADMAAGESCSPTLDERVAKAASFIQSLPTAASSNNGTDPSNATIQQRQAAANKAGPLLRGPALAVVELVKRRLQLGLAKQQELVDAILAYHHQFGHVVSCAMDVACYLPLLSGSTRAALSSHMAERAEQGMAELKQQQQQQDSAAGSSKAMLQLLRRQMAARQIQANLGEPVFATVAAAQQRAQQLLQLYASYLPFYEGLDERERGPADELLWLAAAALMQAAALQQQSQVPDSSSMGYMLQALLALEAAAKGRPYCAPVRLALTGLHGLLGNHGAAAQHFNMLDVKHIQHDTLSSHHLLPVLLGLGASGPSVELLTSMLKLFEDHIHGDAGDSLMQAYEHGSFTKVLEFVCFKERLQRSHNYALARAEDAIISISNAAASSLEAAAAAAQTAAAQLPVDFLHGLDWQGMRFNDDLATRVPFLPPVAGPRHLQLLLWWEQQQLAGSTGSTASDILWWQQVAAAEAELPAAKELRNALRAAAQQRWLLPHLLLAAIQTPDADDGAHAGQPQQLHKLLQQYVGPAGSVRDLEREVQQCFAERAETDPAVPVSRQLQLLDAALLLLAEPVQVLLTAAVREAQPDDSIAANCAVIVAAAGQLVSGLHKLQTQLCEQLQPNQAYLGSLLPGHSLSAAILLVDGSCTWMLLFLEAWSKTVKQLRSKIKAKKSPAMPGSLPLQDNQVQQALQALSEVQAGGISCLEGVVSACSQVLDAKDAEVQLLATFDPSSNPDVQLLLGWEHRVSVQHVLLDAVKAQRQMLDTTRSTAYRLLKRLQHAVWC